jgi:hypothetical protein
VSTPDRPAYHVTARQAEDGMFAVRVRELDRWTQALDRDDVEPMARDLIALLNDVPAESFDVVTRYFKRSDIRRT